MAQALRVPVVGVASLDLVAYPLRHTSRLVVVVLDARRREVFSASYRPVPGGLQRVSDYLVCAPAETALAPRVRLRRSCSQAMGPPCTAGVLVARSRGLPADHAPSAAALVIRIAPQTREDFPIGEQVRRSTPNERRRDPLGPRASGSGSNGAQPESAEPSRPSGDGRFVSVRPCDRTRKTCGHGARLPPGLARLPAPISSRQAAARGLRGS
jgi:hypothetical protein